MGVCDYICKRIGDALPDGGLICVTGNGAAGKTTLAGQLVDVFGAGVAGRYPFDGVYIPVPVRRQQTDENGETITAAHPKCVDLPLAFEVLTAIREKRTAPVFSEDVRSAVHKRVGVFFPKKYNFIDGIGAYHENLRSFYGFLIFVSCSEDTEIARKLARDTSERHQSAEEVKRLFHVRRRQYESFIEPLKRFADIVLRSNSDGGFVLACQEPPNEADGMNNLLRYGTSGGS